MIFGMLQKTLLILCCSLLLGCDSRPEKVSPQVSAKPPAVQEAVVSHRSAEVDSKSEAEIIRDLREENRLLRQQIAALTTQKSVVSTAEQNALPDTNTQLNPKAPLPLPPRGEPLDLQQVASLMSGEIDFLPSAIESSGLPVGESTELTIGQEVQLKWGSTWWAASILGFESDGMVRVHYFGWSSQHDEIVPRSDLQLDSGTKEKAIRTVWPLPPTYK